METIVPGLHGSGRKDESYDGLPSLLTASRGGEWTIAGTVGACSAGAPTLNAPAKEREDVNLASNVLIEREMRWHSPNRLRGGGRRPIVLPLYSSDEEDQQEMLEEKTKQQALKKTRGEQEMVPAGSNNEPTPGPSDQGRSRSPIESKSRARKIESQARAHRPMAADEEDSSPIEILSENYSSPRAMFKKERQSPVELRSSEGEKEKKAPRHPPRVAGNNARPAESSCSSTTEEGSTEPRSKKRRKKMKKMRTGTAVINSQFNVVATNIEELRANAAGKPGRPPTTGQYCKLAENKKALNDEIERERRLEMEGRMFSMEETLDILRKARLDPDDRMDEASLAPTADLASKIREAQAEVVRISKVSSNIKGNLQRALKKSASITLTGLEILRTRADKNAERTGSEELRRMREQLEKLSSAQISMDAKIIELKEEVEKAKELARTEETKKERAMKQLREALSQNVALQKKITEEKEKAKKASITERSKTTETKMGQIDHEPMEVETLLPPPVDPKDKGESASATRPRISASDMAKYPAVRPALKGRTLVVTEERRNLPPPEREEDRDNERISSKRKKGLKGPNWSGMEYYSPTPQPETEEIRDERKGGGDEYGRKLPQSTPTPAPRPSIIHEKSATTGGHGVVQYIKRGRTETQKEKRRENRRRKRQEAAKRRNEILHQAQGPPKSRPRESNQGAQPQAGDSGPASRTRAKTRETAKADIRVSRVAPPASLRNENLPIRDVPIPPDDWIQVQKRGERSKDRTTYAGAVRRTPPSDPFRGKGGNNGQSKGNRPTVASRQQQRGTKIAQGGKSQQPLAHKKPPRTAAVQVACPPGQNAETMRLARERIDIKGLGIEELKPRRARTGALLLEISGANGAAKADALAREMQEALRDREGVVITRPMKTAELRLKDIEESITTGEIAEAAALEGECQETEVKVGPVRTGTNGLGTAWIRCPLIAANRLARKGHLKLGWTRARIEVLPERPMTCFRCLKTGHVRATCPENADRSDLCYRCGTAGHQARGCTAPPKCPLCVGTKRRADHRVGSRACKAPKEKGRRSEGDRRRMEETARLETNHDPEPMDIVVEPERRPRPSQPDRPIIERGPKPGSEPAPLQPSQPAGLVTEKEREKVPSPAPRRSVETAPPNPNSRTGLQKGKGGVCPHRPKRDQR